MRAFVAITLPQSTQDSLHEVQRTIVRSLTAERAGSLARLESLLRWSVPAKMHLTLRFLGEIDGGQRGALEDQLATIATTSTAFSLTVTGLGSFPAWDKPAVLWAGVSTPDGILAQMQARTEEAAQAVGLAAERKPWRPHLTLARVDRNAMLPQRRQLGDALRRAAADPEIAGWQAYFAVDEIVLMQSELHSEGARYTALRVFALPSITGK